ncbi:MAG: M48 family metalloprotease [Nitrosospira sp.]
MNMLLPAKQAFFTFMLMAIASAVEANEAQPSLFDQFIGSGAKPDAVPAGEGEAADGPNIKKITAINPNASVVLDKNCPHIVQPFALTDNAISLATFGVEEAMKAGASILSSFISNIAVAQDPGSINLDTAEEIPSSLKLAAKQLNWLPMTAEVMYGERSHKEETNILARDHKLGKKYYPIADKMLGEILSKVDQTHEYDFKLFILKNNGGNAIARPGGFLYIDQGLLVNNARHPKAYFALAHEVAHVLQRHETKDLQSMVIDSISAKKDLMKVISTAGSNPAGVIEHVKVGKNLFTRHHIDQELQSDACAVKLLDRVFADDQKLMTSIQVFVKDLPPPEPEKAAHAPVSDLERLAASVHEVVDAPIKRHPNTAERAANLDAIYKEIKLKPGKIN